MGLPVERLEMGYFWDEYVTRSMLYPNDLLQFCFGFNSEILQNGSVASIRFESSELLTFYTS